MGLEVATPPIARGIRNQIYTRFCDWKFGISTRGLIEARDLGLANADSKGYSALEYQFLQWVFPLIPFDPADVVFLDYGAGKGRALAVAAARPFRKVIGVEISEDLARIARNNLARMKHRRAGQVEVHCCDAAFFPVPADANVYFFFNPFAGETLAQVIRRIHQSWCGHPRDLFVIFFNHREFDQYIQGQTWLQKVHETVFCGLFWTV